jgi:hypothetical protein
MIGSKEDRMKLTKLQDLPTGTYFRTDLTNRDGRVISKTAEDVEVYLTGKGYRTLHPGVLVYTDRG